MKYRVKKVSPFYGPTYFSEHKTIKECRKELSAIIKYEIKGCRFKLCKDRVVSTMKNGDFVRLIIGSKQGYNCYSMFVIEKV